MTNASNFDGKQACNHLKNKNVCIVIGYRLYGIKLYKFENMNTFSVES